MADQERAMPRRIPVGFLLIGVYKLATAALAAGLAVGLARMYRGDPRATLERLVLDVGLDPGNSLVHPLLLRLAELGRQQIHAVLAGLLGYGALHVAEGIGILRGKSWGEYLIVIASMAMVPVEVWEIARHAGPIRIAALCLNVGIVVYLVGRLGGRDGGVFRSTRSTIRGQSGSEPRNVRP